MSNHLRELLEQATLRAGECLSFDLNARVREARRQLEQSAARAVCFYLGDSRDIAAIDSPSLSAMRVDLPFETTWFEFDLHSQASAPVVFGVMADKAKDGEAWLAAFARIHGEWNYLFTGLTEDNMEAMTCDDDMESVKPEFYRLVIGAIRTALCAMRCANIDRVEHQPSEKLQRARAKRGRLPLFSFWTLEIDLQKSNEAGHEYGGTHASPRLHLRRGHPREYRPGKFCWVQPHAVGNKKLGIVHKDYVVNYGSKQAQNLK